MDKLLLFLSLLVICYASLPDGSYNNLNHPEWGKTNRPFYRSVKFRTNIASVDNLPNPRVVSNTLAASFNPPVNDVGINLLETMFGQFINHDLQSTLRSHAPLILPLPPGDIMNNITGTPMIGYNQWAIIVNDTVINSEGDVINAQTSWFDLSTIYGTSDLADSILRHSNGKLITSQQYACKFPPPDFTHLPCSVEDRVYFDNLPPSVSQVPNLGSPDIGFPPRPDGTGIMNDADFRVNSNVALTLLHALYIREHNRLVDKYATDNPSLSGDELYRKAKATNIAQYQHHVFYEYMKVIIPGIPKRLMTYGGYNRHLIPDTSYEFDFGAFRYGHSAFSPYTVVDKHNVSFQVTPPWYLQINPYQDPHKFVFAGTSGPEPFLIPDVLSAARLEENVWYSLIYGKGGKVDLSVSDDLRNLGLGFFPIDLFAVDILRGRVANIPTYYSLRLAYYAKYSFGTRSNSIVDSYIYGRRDCSVRLQRNDSSTDPISCFLYINPSVEIATKLQQLYKKVKNIDAVVGLLAETTLPGYKLPVTIAHIIFEEYNRKRLSDRFWYENIMNNKQIREINSRTFESVLKDNFNIDANFPFKDGSAFKVPDIAL